MWRGGFASIPGVIPFGSLRRRQQIRIPDNFPQVTIGISKVTGIATIECRLRVSDDFGTSPTRRLNDLIDLATIQNIVSYCEGSRGYRLLRQPRVVGNIILRPDRELQTAGQVEERNSAVFKFATDDAFGGEAKSVPIESQRSFEVCYAQCYDGDARLHDHTLPIDAGTLVVLGRYECSGRTREARVGPTLLHLLYTKEKYSSEQSTSMLNSAT